MTRSNNKKKQTRFSNSVEEEEVVVFVDDSEQASGDGSDHTQVSETERTDTDWTDRTDTDWTDATSTLSPGGGSTASKRSLKSSSSSKSSKGSNKKKRRRRKRRKEQPDGFRGEDINMDEVKEQYSKRRLYASKNIGKVVNDDDDDVDDESKSTFEESTNNPSSTWSVKTSATSAAFLDDDPSEMTYQRRLALYLMKKKWYNPSYEPEDEGNGSRNRMETTDEDGEGLPIYPKPSLEKAWAYFEHTTLQRYVINDDDDDDENASGSRDTNGNRREQFSRGISRRRSVGISQRFYEGFIKSTKDVFFETDDPCAPSRKTRLFDPIGTPHSQVRTVSLIEFLVPNFCNRR